MTAKTIFGIIPTLFALTGTLAQALFVSGCNEARADDGSEEAQQKKVEQLSKEVKGLNDRLRVAEDTLALTDVMNCYGRGHDRIFLDQGTDQATATKILQDCFADDVKTEVFFFNPDTPASTLGTLKELVQFIETVAKMQGYRSARLTPANLRIEVTGADSALLSTSAAAPHFAPVKDPAGALNVDVISPRFENEVVRGADGKWRTKTFRLFVEDAWRGVGESPFGG